MMRMASERIYPHFCMMARALEEVGERWSLLVVRDLLLGPRRFTDLARALGGITPTRLTDRLRRLEAAGIVVREAPKEGREVWYRLTDAGSDLAPVVDALTVWGIEHARVPPLAGEPVHPDPLMIGTKVWLNRYAAPPPDRVAWVWHFPGDDYYSLRSHGGSWELTRGKARAPAVVVRATPEVWAGFLTTPREARRLSGADIQLEAPLKEARKFAKAFGARLGSG
jgi:DNA-binding HxlR family transcriptional regulator